MSDERHDERHEELYELAGLFALDALDPEDRAHFEEHLATCSECQEEVDSFRETAAHLVEDDVPPPPALRESVLSQIDSITQDAPDEVTTDTGEASALASDDDAAPVTPLRPRRRGRIITGVAVAAVAASALMFAAVERPWETDEAPLGPEQQVVAAQDAERFESASEQGEFVVVYSPSKGQAVVELSDLEQPPEGHAYQAWYLHDDADPVSAGVLSADGAPQEMTLLEGDPTGAIGVALTIEPDGGSEQPTTDPFDVVELP